MTSNIYIIGQFEVSPSSNTGQLALTMKEGSETIAAQQKKHMNMLEVGKATKAMNIFESGKY